MTAPARTASPSTLGAIVDIPLARIRAFAGQPRKHFDPATLADLQASIAAVGQQVPVTVRPLTGDPKHDYELVDGERRYRVCQRLKKATVRAWVRDDLAEGGGDQYLASVVSNFGREDHTPVEIADMLAELERRPEIAALPKRADRFARLAAIFGRSTAWVHSYAALQGLTPAARALLEDEIGAGFGMPVKQALAVCGPAEQIAVAQRILRERPTQARAEQWIRAARRKTTTRGHVPADEPARRWAPVRNAIGTIESCSTILVEATAATVRTGVLRMAPGERDVLLRTIERGREQLGEFHQAVRRIVAEAR